MYRDPRCVFVADNIGHADIVALWLDDQGIPAQVMNQATLGWLGWSTFGGAADLIGGMQVWVIDPAQAEKARALVAQHEAQRLARREQAKNAGGQIEAVCEDCGRASSFPARDQGSVQDCPHCGSYLDVPDAHDMGRAESADYLDDTSER